MPIGLCFAFLSWLVLSHAHAAVNAECLSSDVGSFLRCEELHCGGDFLSFADASQWDASLQFSAGAFRQCGRHFRVYESGGDNIDGDISRGQLPGQGFTEADDAGLGRRVVALAGVAQQADYR